MKRNIITILFFAACIMLSAREFNVRDFGAKGDGKADDTTAVQAAADAAVKAGSNQYDRRSIYFPPGTYLLKGTIRLRNISLRGEDAVITQTDDNALSFDYADFWYVRVTGLTFIGGKGHVSLINNNKDKSLFFVDHCRFFECKGTALETRHGAQSCLFTVKNCEFIRCLCSVDSDSDWTVIRDTWIMNDVRMANSAVIVNRHGVMTVDNLLGVPQCNGDNQRWIDNYGSLLATGCRFGAEGGGFTAVYNFYKYSTLPRIPRSVSLKDCQVSAHTSNLRNCAVYCVEIPNIISIENCSSTLTSGILIDPKLKLDHYFCGEPGSITFHEHGNAGFKENIIPKELKVIKIWPLPQPGSWLHGLSLERKIESYKTAESRGTCEVNTLTQPGAELVLENRMDGSGFYNRDLLAIVRKAGPACLMRRWSGEDGGAPFAELRHVEVDLDKTPYLLMDFRSSQPAEFAIKFIDEETGKLYAFNARQRPVGKYEINILRRIPAFKGKKKLTFRIYYIGQKYHPRRGETPHHFEKAESGSVLEIHELGFNSKPRMSPVPGGNAK